MESPWNQEGAKCSEKLVLAGIAAGFLLPDEPMTYRPLNL
jgi:hypothetical protein